MLLFTATSRRNVRGNTSSDTGSAVILLRFTHYRLRVIPALMEIFCSMKVYAICLHEKIFQSLPLFRLFTWLVEQLESFLSFCFFFKVFHWCQTYSTMKTQPSFFYPFNHLFAILACIQTPIGTKEFVNSALMTTHRADHKTGKGVCHSRWQKPQLRHIF